MEYCVTSRGFFFTEKSTSTQFKYILMHFSFNINAVFFFFFLPSYYKKNKKQATSHRFVLCHIFHSKPPSISTFSYLLLLLILLLFLPDPLITSTTKPTTTNVSWYLTRFTVRPHRKIM